MMVPKFEGFTVDNDSIFVVVDTLMKSAHLFLCIQCIRHLK
jgi:hypothetical protein